jgi:hypothetical protein
MAAREYRWRHLVLLIVLYIAAPFVISLPFGIVIMNIVASAVFLAGVYAVSERKRLFVVTVIVAICSVSLSWLVLVIGRPAIVLASETSLALMLSLFAVGISHLCTATGPNHCRQDLRWRSAFIY